MKQHFVKYKYWYITAIVFVIAAWYLFFNKSKNVEDTAIVKQDSDKSSGKENVIDWSKANDNFPLKLGSKGDKVKSLQTWLVNVGGAKLVSGIDGKFGKETESALIAFKQRDNISQEYWDKIGLNVYMGGVAKI